MRLKADPGVLSLSRYEIRKLNEVAERLVYRDDWEVVRLTHEFGDRRSARPATI